MERLPKMLDHGTLKNYHYIVMTLLGSPLVALVRNPSTRIVLQAAANIGR